MKLKAKHVAAVIALASLGSIIYGFITKGSDTAAAHTYIGLGTVGLFLVAMPVFLIFETRGKNIQDYMLTNENIRKMRERKEKKSENQ
ncbi:MAG: hypothetical protein KJN96_09470 [Eudoraea sp.]|nr:hypothetical protein [Eudoraea sp.]